jgi:hypothetical protein
MSEDITDAVPTAGPGAPKLQLVGDPAAAACEGEFCAIPAHHEQAVMNRRIDEDRI